MKKERTQGGNGQMTTRSKAERKERQEGKGRERQQRKERKGKAVKS